MPTSYGISQNAILAALKSGKSKSEIYDAIDNKKEKLFDKGVKPSTIEKMDKLFDKRFDNAMDDYRYHLKNRPGMKEYRKKQRSAKASDTGSEFKSGGKVLKPVDKSKNPGLSKLPTKVRNKMGYMKKGGRVMSKRGMGKAMRGGGCVR